MRPNSKEFKILEAKWYEKLKKSGFDDIEKDQLLKWSSNSRAMQSYTNIGPTGQKSVENYYRLAGYFLHEHNFQTSTDRYVWELHSSGKSMREISNLLKKSNKKRLALTQVKETIHKLKKLMFEQYKDED